MPQRCGCGNISETHWPLRECSGLFGGLIVTLPASGKFVCIYYSTIRKLVNVPCARQFVCYRVNEFTVAGCTLFRLTVYAEKFLFCAAVGKFPRLVDSAPYTAFDRRRTYAVLLCDKRIDVFWYPSALLLLHRKPDCIAHISVACIFLFETQRGQYPRDIHIQFFFTKFFHPYATISTFQFFIPSIIYEIVLQPFLPMQDLAPWYLYLLFMQKDDCLKFLHIRILSDNYDYIKYLIKVKYCLLFFTVSNQKFFEQ